MQQDGSTAALTDRFRTSFGELADIGRADDGGYSRLVWTDSDRLARAWFSAQAARLGLDVEVDRNGNLWAWWGAGRENVVATGSHLDSVVNGGPYDGALGVVGAFLAVEHLQKAGLQPIKPVAIVAFIEEEGARFGVPTLGSRLMAGVVDPAAVRRFADPDGVTFEQAMQGAGLDPDGIGPDPDRMSRIDAHLELHIEQGVGLVDLGQPVGAISGVWAHGRWQIELRGAPDHAGAARLADRRDPVLVLSEVIRQARRQADSHGARATIGRIEVSPNTTNVVAAQARAWLDSRGPTESAIEAVVAGLLERVEDVAETNRVSVSITRESWAEATDFDTGLRVRLAGLLEGHDIEPTEIPTAAGHDAAILAGFVPAAMLHLRNPTGVSHSPDEYASDEDCVSGIEVLASALEDLACR